MPGQVGNEVRVVHGVDAVPDAVGTQVLERVPDRRRTGRLAGVGHRPQPRRPGCLEVGCELRRWHADLGPAQPEADQAVGPLLQRDRQGLVGGGHPELPGDVEAPPQDDAEIALGGDPGVLDRLAHRVRRDPVDDVRVRGDGHLGVTHLLAGQLARDLIGQQPQVLGLRDQVDDRQVDLDEVVEVAEGEVLGEASGSAGTGDVPSLRAASSATIRGEADPTWCTCSSALGMPTMKAVRSVIGGA